ncbi:MAG: helix-turn-helix domain-containing protein [Candidatus Tumulicola sp.]
MDRPEQALVGLGFSAYEARAYVALLGAGTANGYEIAKRSGVPRGNIYDVLDRLIERKSVTRRPGPGRGLFVAVSPGHLGDVLKADLSASISHATRLLATIAEPAVAEPIWEIDGYNQLLAATRDAVSSAQSSIAIALYPNEAAAVGEQAEFALRRGTTVVSVCMASCQRPCGGCMGTIYRRNAAAAGDDTQRSLIVLRDDRYAIAAARIQGDHVSAVRTAQPAIVDLARHFISASILTSKEIHSR